MQVLKSRLYQLELAKQQAAAEADYAAKQKIEWGSQIRSYVLHPYRMVKDLRTDYETGNADAVLDGKLDPFIEAYLKWRAVRKPSDAAAKRAKHQAEDDGPVGP